MAFKIHSRYIKLISLVSLFLIVILVGTIAFIQIEHLSPGDALTLTIALMSTSGSGLGINITSEAGKIFSDFIMIFGVGIGFYSLAQIFEILMTGRLREMLKMVDYEAIISRIKDHVIVCGFGSVGKAAINDLRVAGIPVVVIAKTEESVASLDKDIPRVIGDSTVEEDLARAGIGKAKCVMVTFSHDADAILTVITVKYLSPSLNTIVRAAREDNIDKMYKVGADAVISPELEGGKSMSVRASMQYGKGPGQTCNSTVPPPSR